jgi:hypothetical protein
MLILLVEALCSSETSVLRRAARRNTPKTAFYNAGIVLLKMPPTYF